SGPLSPARCRRRRSPPCGPAPGTGANARSAGTGSPAATGGATPVTGRTAAPNTVPSAARGGPAAAAKGSLLTPANVRTALEAFKRQTGTTTFVEMTVYEGYVLASVPTAAGADTYDRYEYRDGQVKRDGPGGRIDDAKALIDMAAVNWDALPGLLDKAQQELGVTKPTSRYVIVEPWLFDGGSTSVRPYLSDEYGRGGYLYADTQGNVKKVYRS
ncbi:hypothetical protein AB0O29_30930, partial [Streptomyces sp. NPDC089915]